MIDDVDTPLRLVVGHGLRLAIRAYCASLRGEMPVPEIVFGLSLAQVQQIGEIKGADILLADNIDLARAMTASDATVIRFASDMLVAASRPEIRLNAGNLLVRMLDDQLRILIAVPGTAGSADITQRFFAACDSEIHGAGEALRRKVRSAPGTEGLAWGPRQVMNLLGTGEADVVLGPRSMLRSLSAVADVVIPPKAMLVETACGLAIVAAAPGRRALAHRFVDGLLSPSGQSILERHGFGPPAREGARV